MPQDVTLPGWVVWTVIFVIFAWLLFLTRISQNNRERILLNTSDISDIETDLEKQVREMRQELREFRKEMKEDYAALERKLDLFLERELQRRRS